MKMLKGFHYSKEEYQEKKFTILTLDLTSECNYKCDWCCNLPIVNKKTAILTDSEREDIIYNARQCGAKTLVILGAGEPTMDRGLEKLLKLSSSLGLITVLYTNLTGNIGEKEISFFNDSNVSVIVKMDSLNREYFEKRYHARIGDYDNFFINFYNLLNTYKQNTTTNISRVAANMVLTYENIAELENISRFCLDVSVPLYVRPVRHVDGMCDWEKLGNLEGKLYSSMELTKMAAKFNTQNQVLFAPSATSEGYCAVYTYGLTIRNDGTICLCPDNHTIDLGNIRNNSISQVFQDTRRFKPGCCRVK